MLSPHRRPCTACHAQVQGHVLRRVAARPRSIAISGSAKDPFVPRPMYASSQQHNRRGTPARPARSAPGGFSSQRVKHVGQQLAGPHRCRAAGILWIQGGLVTRADAVSWSTISFESQRQASDIRCIRAAESDPPCRLAACSCRYSAHAVTSPRRIASAISSTCRKMRLKLDGDSRDCEAFVMSC